MATYNQHSDDTLGVEWPVSVQAAQVLESPAVAGCEVFTAGATETVDALWVYLAGVAQADARQGSGWEVEVYDASNLGLLATSTAVFRPTSDVRNVEGWCFGPFAPGGTQYDLYRAIDSVSLTPGTWPNTGQPVDNDEFIFPVFGTGYECTFRFGGVSGSFTGRRVVAVALVARVQEYVDLAFVAGMGITPYLNIGGVRYLGPRFQFDGEAEGGHLVTGEWFANPSSKVSWKVADVEQFDTVGGTSSAGWIVDATGSTNNLATILQGWLEVRYTDDVTDPRVAVGSLTSPREGWNRITLTTPAGAAGWAKAAATDYVVTVRRRVGPGKVAWRYLAADEPPGDGPVGYDAEFTDDQVLAGISDEPVARTHALAWEVGGSIVADGSQVYASASDDVEPRLGIDDPWTRVYAGNDVTQQITTGAGGTYGWLRAFVRVDPGVTDLLMLTVNDGGSTPLIVDPSDLDGPGWQYVEGEIGSAVLSGATQYEVTATSTASDPAACWHVQVLSALRSPSPAQTPATAQDATFGAGTDTVVVDAVAVDEADAVVTIATQPDAPADLVVAVVTDTDLCSEHVEVTWSPVTVTDGGGFYRYEVERNDTGEWQPVAHITDPAEALFDDYEVRRNTAATYRVRVRRVDRACSSWSTSEPVTASMDCCGWLFTSNEDPAVSVWADDVGTRTVEWETAPTLVPLMGRDYRAAFYPLEWRGDAFDASLLVAAQGGKAGTTATTTPGRRTFDPVLGVLPQRGAGLSYVAVCTSDGDRWFAAVEVKQGAREEPGGAYLVDVRVTEVTDRPSTPDAGSPGGS